MLKKIHICIPRNFLVINVCNQGKTLCSPCTSVICIKVLAQYRRLRYDLVSSEATLIKTCNSAASERFKTRHGSAAIWVTSGRAGKTCNASIRDCHWTRCCADTIRCDTIPFCPHSGLPDISLNEDCCTPARDAVYSPTHVPTILKNCSVQFLVRTVLNHEDGGSKFLRNIPTLLSCLHHFSMSLLTKSNFIPTNN